MVRGKTYSIPLFSNALARKFIFPLVFFFLLLFSPIIHAASTYRQAIEVNSTIALTDFQVLVIIDTAALVAAGQMRADGGDIRFTDSDGLTALPFWIENVSTYVAGANSVSSMNTSATRIWVRIPNIPINPPDPRKIINMFYGDPAATSVANGAATFLFFDDFSGGLGKWTIHKQPAPGNISIVGGYLNCGGGFAGGDYGHTVIGSVNSYNTFTDGVIEVLIYMTANSIAEISYRGNFANNTGYKVRWDQRPGTGMGFLKPPYFTGSWRFWNNIGEPNPAGQDMIGFTTGYWFPAKIEASGYNVKTYQGATVFSCADGGVWSPPAPSNPVVNRYPGPGEISLQNHYGIWCRYDDIRVRRIAAAEPTTVLLGHGNLTVTRVDASQPTVNQGQSGVSVSMQIDNFSDESVSFLGGSLIFSLGSYTQTLIAPPPGTIIPGHGRITASFSVDILPDSPLGDAAIDGAAIISGLVDLDGSAALKGNWTIQKPPSLVIDQITASATAYRGEVNRPVVVNVRNAGEATAYWDSSTLQFTLGNYTAIYPQTAFPVKLLGGASATAIYGVDISPDSPIGTSTIDAEVAGLDGNTLYPILVTGALLPTEWNIPEEYLRTYQDAFYFNHSQKFNLPKVGFSDVYAQAKCLTPFTEFVVRWLNPSGTQVAFTNPPITSNASGILAHRYQLGITSPTGDWTVRITNPLNTKIYCESHFQVVGGASLSAILLLPPTVSVGQTFSSTMTLINSGDTALTDAQPGTIATAGTGLATLVSGPIPPLQNIPANSQATFTWTWSAQTPGTFVFFGMGYGWDANSFERRAAPAQPQDGSGGLRADYFDNINFTGAQLVRLDPTVNFNWAVGSPNPSMGADSYSVRWTGWVMPEFTENYTFYTTTDDGVRLWVNGILIVDKWVNQAATEWSGSIGLTAGEKYPITMEYFENTNDAEAQLSWSSPSTAKAIVPANRLFPTSLIDVLQEAEVHLIPEGSGFYGYYFDQDNFAGPLLMRTDPVVDFNWGNFSPDPAMGVDNFTVRWRAWVIPQFTDTYTFFTTTDDGARLWVNDFMLVNKWVNQGPTTWSGSIPLTAGQKYPLTMEYYENGGGASAQLSWKTPSTAQVIIPQARAIPRPFCVIQSPPNLSILSVTATPTTVFRNQSDIEVEAVVKNSGEVTAEVTAASLTFTLGNLTQTVSSPILPKYLPGNNATASVRFKISVDLLSPMGLSEFSCNILSRDTNIPTSVSWLNLAIPKDSWTISQHGLTNSAFPSYTPDQGTFNRGQTLYTKGFFQTPGLQGRIRFYNTQLAYTTPAPAGWVSASGLLTADAGGNLLTTYTLLPTANLGTWTALVENNAGTVLAINHFAVKSMGNLVASLTLSPSPVFLGATFTAELSVKNTVPGGSPISPAVPWPILPTGGSTGKAILLSGPTPAQGSISDVSPGTFTWVFQAIEDTGDVGSYSLTASFTTFQTYRMPLSISNATTLANHQVRLTINTAALVGAGKMRSDCADIRFRDSDSQTDLPYWLESGANTANTVLWVKVPAITANIPKTIYLYYGNPAAITSSNGNAVFEFFDHFTTLSPTVWDRTGTNSVAGSNLTINTGAVISHTTVSSQDGMAVEASVRWNNFSGYSGLAISNFQSDKINNNPGSHKLVNLMTNNAGSNSVRARAANGTAASYNITNGTAQFNATAGTNYIIGYAILSGQIRILQNRAILNSYAGTWTGPFYLWLGHITGSQAGGTDISDLLADWVLVRKFVTPEPAVSIGSEESPTLYPLISGIDICTGNATDSNSGISNGIRILSQSIALSSDVIDLGTIPCGETRSTGNSTASNTGNAGLTMVRWQPMNLESLEGAVIDKTNLLFSPDPVGPIALGNKTPASVTLFVPFSQASGTYIATMAIYDDVNGNLWRDLGATGEPVDFFSVRVVVPSNKRIEVVEDFIDLGNWEIGMTTIAKPLQAFNSGNLALSNLEFKQIVGTNSFPIIVNPATATLATDAFLFADVIASLTVGPTGDYIATWTLWNDTNSDHVINAGEASDSFRVRIGVGLASLTITPPVINFGICSPAVTISQQVNLKNTGQVSLNNLKTALYALQDGLGNLIATDQVSLTLPANATPGTTHIATVSLFIPSGTTAGTYTGIQLVYEDRNTNGTLDPGEASASLTITLIVPSLRQIEVYSNAIDMGSIIPGTTKTLTLDCRNIGNTEFTNLRWEKSNLLDGVKVFDALNASFPPSEPFAVATGAFFSRNFQLSVPLAQASGSYFSTAPNYWLFNDDNLNTIRSGNEPEDTFTVKCQIGWWTLDILETTLNSGGDPSQPSTAASFFVKNIGELSAINVKATASILLPVIAGPPNILSQANIVGPLAIGGISAGQTKAGTWQVAIPDGCTAGNYSGTLTVWDDCDGNSLIDVDEVRDTVGLILTVNSKRVIKVIQNPLNLGWTLSGTTVQGAFEVVNVGNLDLAKVTPLASKTFNLGNTIPAGNISFNLNPLGFMPVGTAKIATVTVIVGWPRADGTYRGNQRIFDDYNGVDGLYSANEESCLFELTVSIGYKKLSVTNPVAFDNQNPGQTITQAFSVKNETTVPLTAIKWLKGQLESGPDIIPVASLSFTPAGPIGIGGSNSRACSAKIVLGATIPPGNYIGTHTVWEDNNGDGNIQSSEASATFNTTLTVNPLPALEIQNPSISGGQVAAGTTSPWVEVLFTNTGNVALTSAGLFWSFNAMNDGFGNSFAATTIIASTTIAPDPLLPNQTGRAFFRFGPVPAGQVTGLYQGSPQTFTNGGTANDFCEFTCEIIPGGPQNLPRGCVIQDIATTTFPAPSQRYFLSAFVCPGTGSAKISLIGRDEANANTTQAFGMEIKNNLTLTTFGPGIHSAEILETIPPSGTHIYPWYRIYFAFDFVYDPLLASRTYLSLENSSPDTASHAVWFDGVQFERSIFPDQIRPTAFSPGKKIVSPNTSTSLSGQKLYMEW